MRMVVEMMSLMTVKMQMEKMQSVIMVVVFHVMVVSDTHVVVSEVVKLMKVMLVVILNVLVQLVDIVDDVVRVMVNLKEMLMMKMILRQEQMKIVMV